MKQVRFGQRLLKWLRLAPRAEHSIPVRGETGLTHVIILDGTMSSMVPGWETNAGITYRLLQEVGYPLSVYYEAGVQFRNWRTAPDVLMGRGINRQIKRAYGYLASRYRPWDKIILIGYSRGAYAVRSLGGIIETVGLLKSEEATVRNVRQAYRLYRDHRPDLVTAEFREANCHDAVSIEAIGVWDTVKALGVRLPYLWRLSAPNHAFHNHRLGASVRHGFHAVALNETRQVFEPVMWECSGDESSRVKQMWFRGSHGDIGGMLGGFLPARLLSNIPLIWMLEQLERHGLALPDNWQVRFPTKSDAPSVGTWRGWGFLFLLRRPRKVGDDVSQAVHPSADSGR